MRVFTVGATGAVGRRVVSQLLQAGHEVSAVGRSAARLHDLSALGAAPVLADLFDATAIRTAMRGHDAVINVATRVPSPAKMLMPGAWKEMDKVRTQGAAIVADAVLANGIGRLVQESFAPIYPDSGSEWITERTAVTPARYNRSTMAAEGAAERASQAGGVGVVLRFGMFYGPGDAFADQVFASIRKGWSPFVGRPDGYLSFITHHDAAAAAVAALDVPTGIYNVVDDEPMTRQALASSLARMLGVKPPHFLPTWIAWLGGSLGETLSRSLRISNEKLRQASEWAPVSANARVGFEAALAAEQRGKSAA